MSSADLINGLTGYSARSHQPLSARCCQISGRPSRADGGCYPEGRTPDSIAPSAVNLHGRRAYFSKDATRKRAAGSVPATALDTQGAA